MISRLVIQLLCLIALLTVYYYNRNEKQLFFVYIYVHGCDLMETHKIEDAWVVFNREHS